ncbi:hypothetical protein ElyMa_005290100 [Elysia marginata]|uniref:Uncharacterized protein n=1 Tax=Elysia marginata TaxID=1093978 RepID=A0AAV4JZ86_9GAST|nr:hypothetical protein ElyMa_005290100 [Elysia marginata]
MTWSGIEPTTSRSQVRRANHSATQEDIIVRNPGSVVWALHHDPVVAVVVVVLVGVQLVVVVVVVEVVVVVGGQGKVRVNCFPKATATWHGRESNPRPPDRESDALTTPPRCPCDFHSRGNPEWRMGYGVR